MTQHKSLPVLCFCLLLLCVMATSSAAAGRSINLAVDQNSVTNIGGQTITFNWNIVFDTTCTTAQLQIIGPAPSTTVVLTQPIPCGVSPIAGSFVWNVPLGQAPGVYTARLTFVSHWSGSAECCPRDFTDLAEVQFSVCCVSQVQFCKFLDVNGNGVRDPGDPALGGWTFTVRALTANCATQGALIATGVTDPVTGCVTLSVPMNPCDATATTFCVSEAPPLGDTRQWLRTTPSPGPFATPFQVTVTACQTTTVNVGNWCPGRLTFCKFLDADGSGSRGPGDTALGGWTFTVRTLTANCATQGTVVATGTTDPTTGCTPELVVPVDPSVGSQTYCVTESPPAGDTRPWLRTTPAPGLASTPFQVTATGCTPTTIDVGDWCPGTVTFCKFLDVNGDGVKDPTDPPLSGWTFTVRTATTDCATQGTIVVTAVTNGTGCTPALTVPVDPLVGQQNFCVYEAPPSGDTRPWLRTTPTPGPFASAFPITVLGCGQAPLTVNVGDWCPGRVRFCKFLDLDGSGTQGPSDPPLGNWTFTIRTATTNCATQGTLIATAVTDPITGCTPELVVPVDPVAGQQNYCVSEAPPPGDLRPWLRTTPSPGPFSTAFPITVLGCQSALQTITVGNWVPVIITGFKYEDLAPWPWISPSYVGPEGQHNDPLWEPVPNCVSMTIPVQTDPQTLLPSPGIPGVTVGLFDAGGVTPLLPPVVTDATGKFTFGPFHFDSVAPLTVTVKELNVPAQPSSCDPNAIAPVPPADLPQPFPWPGVFEGTVAQSIWPCPTQNFTTPDVLQLDLPVPTVANFEYGFNFFYNRQPGRIWGQICPETVELQKSTSPPLPNRLIGVDKIVDAVANPFPNPNTSWGTDNGIYVVPELPQEPFPANNNRWGTYRLTPAAPSDPEAFTWQYRVFCAGGGSIPDFTPLPASGFVDILVPPGRDVRVDFCLQKVPSKRQCFQPVTITQQGWATLGDPNSTVVPGGMIYGKFPIVFANFVFFGELLKNEVAIGQKTVSGTQVLRDLRITFAGTTLGLNRLRSFLAQSTGTPSKLNQSYLNPSAVTGTGGSLAGQLLALELNIAYNDMRQMPRPPGWGYNLELFTVAQGLFKGKTVREVRNIADAILAGDPPCQYGLPNPTATGLAELVDILSKINANYEFDDMNTFNDRGYLIPDPAEFPFGSQPKQPPVTPVIP